MKVLEKRNFLKLNDQQKVLNHSKGSQEYLSPGLLLQSLITQTCSEQAVPVRNF